MMNQKRPDEAWGKRLDRAMQQAFWDAVRLHRLHRIPLVVWRDGGIREVDPFTIELPEDDGEP